MTNPNTTPHNNPIPISYLNSVTRGKPIIKSKLLPKKLLSSINIGITLV